MKNVCWAYAIIINNKVFADIQRVVYIIPYLWRRRRQRKDFLEIVQYAVNQRKYVRILFVVFGIEYSCTHGRNQKTDENITRGDSGNV